jgi:uncharacterized membrane protein YgcG
MSFIQPGLDTGAKNNPSEDTRYGTVVDPFKFPDPKKQGRVKFRVPELHGDENSGIPDEHLPWAQLERSPGFGNNAEQSTFGLPQKGAMMKARAHGADKYSPLVNGAPYSTPGKIKEFSGDSSGSGGGGGSGGSGQLDTGSGGGDSGGSGGTGQDSGFNQKDHYGHKDPLGNLYHVDMKKKTLNIDWTKLSEVIIKSPKISWDVQDTKHDRTKGWGESGSQTPIQGGGGSSGGSSRAGSSSGGGSSEQPPEGQDTVKGDITWTVAGQHQNTVQGKVTETFNDEHASTVSKDVTFSHKQNYTHNVGQKYTRNVGASSTTRGDAPATTVINPDGSRSDKNDGKWSSKAPTNAWNWMISLTDMDG